MADTEGWRIRFYGTGYRAAALRTNHMTRQVNNSFQHVFLERLAKRFSSRSEMVRQVSGVLHVGRDAVYRRMRGDTALTADEMMLLSETFQLKLEAPTESGEVPKLRYPHTRDPIHTEFDHFSNMERQLAELKRLPGASIDLASPELPMYYEMSTPLLCKFKTFTHGITLWDIDKWKDAEFTPDLISDRIYTSANRMIQDHYRFPTREIWSVGLLDVTLRQINYMVQVGRLRRREYIEQLFDELLQIVDHLERMTRSGKRFPMGEEPREDSPAFRVYHNELSNTNNIVLVKTKMATFVFTSLIYPSYIVATDNRLCAEVKQWFDNLVAYGTSLHADAGKCAGQYFLHLRTQIEQHRNRV